MNKKAFLTLIGLQVRIASSKDPTLVGLSGKVVLETRNTLVISTGNETKIVPKQIADFEFDVAGTKLDFVGSSILGRADERIARVP